jgi:preprotein translocase subunit SecF
MSKLSGLGGRLYRGETSVDFIGRRRRWYTVSGVFILISIAALAIQGLQLGIEFKGGSSFTVTTTNPSVTEARAAIEEAGVTGEAIIQQLGEDKVRVQTGSLEQAQNDAVQDALAAKFSVSVSTIDTQIIGPSWGKEITRKALYGLFGFLFVVMVYLAMALEPKMAVAAIIAVIHDVFITVGIYALVGFDVTPATIIGFLTILGYSLYDTVVVFDKVRENTLDVEFSETTTFASQVNLAINQTLVRSVNTSVVAVLPVAAILFVGATALGAGTLRDISLALFIGIIAGTYSSVFLAGPLYVDLRARESRFKDKTASAKL